jgi:hypothetical protein
MTPGAVKFSIDQEWMKDLTVEEFECFEDFCYGEVGRTKLLRKVLAHFLLDADGKRVRPYAEAVKRIGAMSWGDIGAIAGAFREALREDAVPPASAGS